MMKPEQVRHVLITLVLFFCICLAITNDIGGAFALMIFGLVMGFFFFLLFLYDEVVE